MVRTRSLFFRPMWIFSRIFLEFPSISYPSEEGAGLRGCSPAALRCHDSSNAAPRHLCATNSRILPTLFRTYLREKTIVSPSCTEPFSFFQPLRKRKTGAFSFKINKFLQRDSYVFREYTYSLLSELFCSR